MKDAFRLTMLFFVWMMLAGPGYAQPAAVELPEAVVESVQARVDGGKNVGIVVGLVDSSGARFYTYGSTTLDGDQDLTEETVFEIGSITKVFTGIVLADMSLRGEVALDDPIARYLPDSVAVPARGEAVITLEHLSTHTSGLPRMPTNFAPTQPWNPYADYTVAHLYDFLSTYTLPRDVGAEAEYSNYGVGLLGHLLARHHGTAYEALVEERITGVLGLGDTRITLTPSMQARLARGHAGRFTAANWDLPTLAGAGALRATARDLLRFVAANLGLVASPLAEAMALAQQPRAHLGRADMQIGLGWVIRTSDAAEVVWHNGGTGGYRSFAGFNRQAGTGVVVLTNSTESVDDLGFHLLDPTLPLRDDLE